MNPRGRQLPGTGPGRKRPMELLPWQWGLLVAVAGIYASFYPFAGTGAGVAAAVIMRLHKGVTPGLAWMAAAFALGLIWGFVSGPAPQPSTPEWMLKRLKIPVQARIDAVQFKPEHRLRILLSSVHCQVQGAERILPGRVVWTWAEPARIPAPGQQVRLRMRIKPVHGFCNFHTWDTRAYWARQGVYYRGFSKGEISGLRLTGEPGRLWTWRLSLRSAIAKAAPPGPGRGLLLTLLMGDRSQVSYATLDLVRRASLAHSLALSGLHLGFVIFLAWMLAKGLGRLWPELFLHLPRPVLAAGVGVPLVVAYIWLGQGRASLIRAALMFFFWVVLMLRGRSAALLDGLFFALLLFVLIDPQVVFTLGWQLSMVAVAGILVFWPIVGPWVRSRGSWIRKVCAFFVTFLVMSVVATLTLLPLLMSSFGQVSPNLYLNMLWLPALGFWVLPLGLSGMVLSLCPGMGSVSWGLLYLAGVVLNWMMQALLWLDAHGWLRVWVTMRPGWVECLGYWLVLGALVLGWRTRPAKGFWAAGCGLMLMITPWAVQSGPWAGDTFQVRVIDVGQGQAVCLQGPEGKRTLIDGGGSWNPDFDIGRFALSPALTYRRWPEVNTVILSHSDFDHLRGLLFILRHYTVRRFVYNGHWPTGWDGRTLRRILDERGIRVLAVKAGDTLDLGPELDLQVLYPPPGVQIPKANDRSLVLRACFHGHGLVLVPGDIEMAGIMSLLSSGSELQSDMLLIPHHGSRSSLAPDLYAAVAPKVAAASCGFLNIFHFPHPKVREALAQSGIEVLSTSTRGQIKAIWDLKRCGRVSLTTRLGHDGERAEGVRIFSSPE